jgi:hypothetical protein
VPQRPFLAPIRRAEAIAPRQYGLVTRAQAYALGMTDDATDYLLAIALRPTAISKRAFSNSCGGMGSPSPTGKSAS